jgi:hypothetical protein
MPNYYLSSLGVKKYYLNVPYERKEEVKEFGCRFDFQKKKWYIYNNNPKFEDFIDNYTYNIFVEQDEIEDYWNYKYNNKKKKNDDDLEELEKEFQNIIKSHH